MKTKQEVIGFLESKVGTKVPCKGNSSLDGQCVTLIKALMEFIGVPEPYKARGHANSCITAYLNDGIADAGTGFLSVFSNKNMGGGYGHIWVNVGDGSGTYYESNGAKPLTVTKGEVYTYDSVCNFDKYIKEATMVGELMQIEKADFEKLMKEAKERDEQIDLLLIDKKSLENDIREINFENEKLAEQLKECQKKLTTPMINIEEQTTISGKVGVLNGWTIDSKGVVVANYRIK